MEALLEKAGMAKEANQVTFSGPEGTYGKVENFTVDQIRSGKIFLAYEVNGKPLLQKHGFPLRLVAVDHVFLCRRCRVVQDRLPGPVIIKAIRPSYAPSFGVPCACDERAIRRSAVSYSWRLARLDFEVPARPVARR